MNKTNAIQPWKENPSYWQHHGEPVLLLGGSVTDHLFQIDGLKEHLDEMVAVGANYVRNTMSQRTSKHLMPYPLMEDGTYDMTRWNEDNWTRFANFLRWTAERRIFVQIEVWDRFDYSRENWEVSPWNPKRNHLYTYEETGFAPEYPEHPYTNKQPFFHTFPGMPLYDPRLDQVRALQEACVDKMLSHSLEYDHVLYCMSNETSTPPEWGQYWIAHIRKRAKEKGVVVQTTDMFDDTWKAEKAEITPVLFEKPEFYDFIDVSQVNSRNFDERHWEVIEFYIQKNKPFRRPANHNKIYGGGYYQFGTGGNEDGVERFWRNLLAGSAAVRFHRPDAGNGLNDRAKACISAARNVEKLVKFWELTPRMDLLSERAPNAAYLACDPGKHYILYFPYQDNVTLDLRGVEGKFILRWVSITEGKVLDEEKEITAGDKVPFQAPYKGGWVAVLTRP